MNTSTDGSTSHVFDENEVVAMRQARAELRCQYVQVAAKRFFLETLNKAKSTAELRPDVELLDTVYQGMDKCSTERDEISSVLAQEITALDAASGRLNQLQQQHGALLEELEVRRQEIDEWKQQPALSDSANQEQEQSDAAAALQFIQDIPGVTIQGAGHGTLLIEFGNTLTLGVVRKRGARNWLLQEVSVRHPKRAPFKLDDLIKYCVEANDIPLLVSETLARIGKHRELLAEMEQISSLGLALCDLHHQKQGEILVTMFSGVSCRIEVSPDYPGPSSLPPRLTKIDTMGLYNVEFGALVTKMENLSLTEMVQTLVAKFPAKKQRKSKKN